MESEIFRRKFEGSFPPAASPPSSVPEPAMTLAGEHCPSDARKKNPPCRLSRPTGHSCVGIIDCVLFLQVQQDVDYFFENLKNATHKLKHTSSHHTPPNGSVFPVVAPD